MEQRLNRIEVPQEYEVLDADALAARLGFKRQTVQAYISRGNWSKIPKPNRQLKFGPIWYEVAVRAWESKS
jgi:predicted DNA-binding transcriptional regulator AlpA